MFIQTESTSDPEIVRFLPGQPVLPIAGTVEFPDEEAAGRSPLALRLFAVEGVAAVTLEGEAVAVTREAGHDWQIMKPAILGAIMEHFTAGDPVIHDAVFEAASAAAGGNSGAGGNGEAEPEPEGDAGEIVATVKELIETRIKPVTAEQGGAVNFHSYKEGVVYLEFEGPAHSLMGPIGNMIRHYVPEIKAVRDHTDAIPKPGLETPAGLAVRRILDDQINPAVAAHGGHIALVDVQEERVYVRLEGGCQGCGMANVTLKQGIETALRREVPEITEVLDVTDHAGGTNPYYAPSGK